MGESNLKAVCPFHSGDDRTFSISLESGAWICFHRDCGESGSFVTLLRKLGLSPTQIDRTVQNVKPKLAVPDFLRIRAELAKEPVFLPEYILGVYGGPPAQLLRKGFSEEILRAHEVGYDAQRQRITFPVRDFAGRLAAINGRAIENWMSPRYKVYDARKGGEFYGVVEKYVPDNRRHLYGFHTVYPERFFKDEAGCSPLILVEGYKACLWLRQLGFPHTVALQGSSLSRAQRTLLERLAGPFYVMLDHQAGKGFPDSFGRCAALQIAEALGRAGKALICQYKSRTINTQPDSLNEKEVQDMIDEAQSPIQLRL